MSCKNDINLCNFVKEKRYYMAWGPCLSLNAQLLISSFTRKAAALFTWVCYLLTCI